MDWIIYYDDGSTFSSDDGQPADAPGWGVQVIAVRNDEVGRRLHSQADYYIYHDDEWIGVDFVGLMDYLVNILNVVKVGRMIDREAYRELLHRAATDDELPRKSAKLAGEVVPNGS